jgi:hypothetical protein
MKKIMLLSLSCLGLLVSTSGYAAQTHYNPLRVSLLNGIPLNKIRFLVNNKPVWLHGKHGVYYVKAPVGSKLSVQETNKTIDACYPAVPNPVAGTNYEVVVSIQHFAYKCEISVYVPPILS